MADNAVIVELKQWDRCQESEGENEVLTFLGVPREIYCILLSRLTICNVTSRTTPLSMMTIQYLLKLFHIYIIILRYQMMLYFTKKFESILTLNPIFTADDVDSFLDYLRTRIR
ncbi:MAG: hypothetical protein U5N58_00945 [Actinomycetota bacterium]|nr:hypothetical protein [Actinomycetota bacterium]